jgi:hypothetical protein
MIDRPGAPRSWSRRFIVSLTLPLSVVDANLLFMLNKPREGVCAAMKLGVVGWPRCFLLQRFRGLSCCVYGRIGSFDVLFSLENRCRRCWRCVIHERRLFHGRSAIVSLLGRGLSETMSYLLAHWRVIRKSPAFRAKKRASQRLDYGQA